MLPASDPLFLGVEDVLALHEDLIVAFGGIEGHKQPLVESIVAYPQQKYSYADSPPSIPDLAAYFAFAVAKFHAFADGNKRTAAAGMELFLNQNGFDWLATDDEAIPIFLALAAGAIDEQQMVAWVNANCRPSS